MASSNLQYGPISYSGPLLPYQIGDRLANGTGDNSYSTENTKRLQYGIDKIYRVYIILMRYFGEFHIC